MSLSQCSIDPPMPGDGDGWVYEPEPFDFSNLPLGLPNATFLENEPANNPTSVQGVRLGRKLFYDPILSGDSTQSCSDCHKQEFGFTDGGNALSLGIDGLLGRRNAMPIFNLGYQPVTYNLPPFDTIGFFWDGRAPTMEEQALRPIQDPVEMHETLENVVIKLNRNETYKKMFFEAFGTTQITAELVGNAIAQFERTIVSGNTKYDKATNAVPGVFLTEQELLGAELFNDLEGGDCFHCHVVGGAFTDFTYRNNGLDFATSYTDFIDGGLGEITGIIEDYGKFKVPSLRNLIFTAPYMHDGRFATLEEVLEHYNEHVQDTEFTDPFMQLAFQNGVQIGEDSITAIIAFLKTLTDSTLITNPDYGPPDY
ncbi:MAG: cytochrome-c peroxidase [Chitinophagales bacterium]